MARRLRSVEVSSDEDGEAWQVKAVSVWSGLVGLGVSRRGGSVLVRRGTECCGKARSGQAGLGGSGMLRFGWVS